MAQKVLFITQEISPYVADSTMSTLGRKLPSAAMANGCDIRTFMPKWGHVNERRNQLHEVIRLSGMNIIISDVDRPLIIKVASISSARIQVYFIDNEDYFRRKQVFRDDSGNFFEDNGERAIFFARGVLETVKKLRWTPDVIHCQGWISHLLPLYLKKAYKDDPIFTNSKVVLSLYDDIPSEKLAADTGEAALFGNITAADIPWLMTEADGINLAKTAISYSDGVIMGSEGVPAELGDFCSELKLPVLPFDANALESGKYVEDYDNFYDSL